MRDPAADISRRAWLSCTRCAEDSGCLTCRGTRNCSEHWLFMLASDGPQVFVQCPSCHHRWWHHTEFGAGDRPEEVDHIDYEQLAG